MLTIGLTGGIASGKSTVAHYFAALGIGAVDADIVAREVVASGEPLLAEIKDHFGDKVIMPSGELDRSELRQRIFSNPAERHWLNTHMHPVIRQRMLAALPKIQGPYRLLIVPLLIESGNYRDIIDRTLVIDVPEEMQMRRLMQRDNSSHEQAQAILSAQLSRHDRLASADDIIDNSQDPLSTQRRVKELDGFYRNLATLKQ